MAEGKPIDAHELREFLRLRLAQLSLPKETLVRLVRLVQAGATQVPLSVIFSDQDLKLLLDAIMDELAERGVIRPGGEVTTLDC